MNVSRSLKSNSIFVLNNFNTFVSFFIIVQGEVKRRWVIDVALDSEDIVWVIDRVKSFPEVSVGCE